VRTERKSVRLTCLAVPRLALAVRITASTGRSA
jgi:hypothetical protein